MKNHYPMIKTIIVDDEKLARDIINNYVKESCPSLEIVATCKSVDEAYKAIRKYNPQLVFLDIEMPDKGGFELLKMFKTFDFHVVFTTAYASYAARAFRVSATDFLLKPIKISELNEAINKVKENLERKSSQNILSLLENLEFPEVPFKKLVIPNSKGFSVIDPADIILCEADGYCTIFYLGGNSRITSSYHLRYYEDLLDSDYFIRVHNSYIINLNKVTGYSSQGEIQLSEDTRCPLSAARKQAFFNAIKRKK